MHKLFLSFSIFSCCFALAGTADTISIYSNAMHRSYNCVVVKPDTYSNKNASFETVYLLHGHGGYYSNWIKQEPDLKKYADEYQMIIVCPEGKAASWYFDSPVVDSMQFDTYISKEVPAYIDAHYNTIKNRNARAITGLSMGGHGALYLSFRHPEQFGACGSMSGAFIINLIAMDKRYGIQTLLGDSTNFQRYLDYNIMNAMEQYPKDSLAIIFDCGTEDFIIEMNRMVHKKMLQLKIPHEYIERPGRHEWKYWKNALQYQLFYFRNFFDRKKIAA